MATEEPFIRTVQGGRVNGRDLKNTDILVDESITPLSGGPRGEMSEVDPVKCQLFMRGAEKPPIV